MSTPNSENLKAMMQDLEKRKKALTKHFDEFESLQNEIQALNQRASNGDAPAIKKITNLANSFPNGFSQQQKQILLKAKEIEKNFKTIKSQFKQIDLLPTPTLNNNIKENTITDTDTNKVIKNKVKRPKIKSFC